MMRKAEKEEAGATTEKACKSLIWKKKIEMPFLPQELIFNILVRLRADKVYKFRRVCKSWYNLIHDNVFIQSHLEHSIPGLIIKQRFQSHDKYIFETDFIEMRDRKNTKQDIKLGITGEVIGSCNGLVLIRTPILNLSVVNLITNQRVKLPSTKSSLLDILSNPCGLTYVPETGIYKLVRLQLLDDYVTLHCEVLSLGCSGCNSWRYVNESSISVMSSEDEKWKFHRLEPVTINGIVYFVGIKLVQPFSIHIPSFDAGAEVFHKIQAPVHEITRWDSFLELGGVLSFVQVNDLHTFDAYSVWILKDWLKGTWVKQHIISIGNPSVSVTLHLTDDFDIPRVLSSFSHGGRKVIIFQRMSFSGILSHIAYDLELNKVSKIQYDIRGYPSGSFTYVNSLISPKLLYLCALKPSVTISFFIIFIFKNEILNPRFNKNFSPLPSFFFLKLIWHSLFSDDHV